jgi:molecular chaperone IbpA
MTNQLSLRSFDIPKLHRYGVGLDRMFDRFDEILRSNASQAAGYPPYNMIKYSDDSYAIELAVAGFKPGEISMEVKENVLTIEGKQPAVVDDTKEFIHRGISGRDFSRAFTLAEHVEVLGASQENGILTVTFERRVPEEKKPRKIEITHVV